MALARAAIRPSDLPLVIPSAPPETSPLTCDDGPMQERVTKKNVFIIYLFYLFFKKQTNRVVLFKPRWPALQGSPVKSKTWYLSDFD